MRRPLLRGWALNDLHEIARADIFRECGGDLRRGDLQVARLRRRVVERLTRRRAVEKRLRHAALARFLQRQRANRKRFSPVGGVVRMDWRSRCTMPATCATFRGSQPHWTSYA